MSIHSGPTSARVTASPVGPSGGKRLVRQLLLLATQGIHSHICVPPILVSPQFQLASPRNLRSQSPPNPRDQDPAISPMAAATATYGLIGPPAFPLPPVAAAPVAPVANPGSTTGVPFLDLMDAKFNTDDGNSDDDGAAPQPMMGRTENNSATYLSSGDPCLDFFFQVVPNTPGDTVTALLSAAWNQDPLTALKLVCHLRGVRGTGKSDRKGFYAAALWLHSHHPKTLALNAGPVVDFGYMKDLPEILHRLVAGPKPVKPRGRRGGRARRSSKGFRKRNRKVGTREERLAAEMAKMKILEETAANLRVRKRAEMAKVAAERYARDPDFRFLHDRTSDLFAGFLSADLEKLNSGNTGSLSLAAKWCPSLDSSYDLSTLLCETIARRLFPRDSNPEYAGIEEQHYAYRVRDRLRKEVLVPLRRALELPEVYMCARQWESLPYNRVPSVAMKNYKKLFQKHDPERFDEFLEKVKKGEAKIAAGALLPHEILAPAVNGEDDEVAGLQWERMVSDLSERGKLKNCIAVCDVSGSMGGTPMDVCVALGLLVSELSEEPWKGRVITFSADPQLHMIKGDTLRDKVKFVLEMEWGMNTDFQKVFDQILSVAKEGKLEPEKMIKRVFVFSDMEFDEATRNDLYYNSDYNSGRENSSWETDYQVICQKFEESGYGSVVPEIVFWNLRDSRSTPVPSNQKGVALVSGFSKNLMKLFLEGDGILNPRDVMEEAIAGKEYEKLVVFD